MSLFSRDKSAPTRPVLIVTNNAIAARFWMTVALILATLAVLAPFTTILALKEQEKVVILSPDGQLIYAPAVGFQEAGALHAYHVRLACLALLQRNPSGLDLPELFEDIYIDPAKSYAKTLIQASAAEFQQKQIHQKVELNKIDILASKRLQDKSGNTFEALQVRASGNLIRTGTLKGIEFREPATFQVNFLFIRNPDLLANGRLPLVVYHLEFKETAL